MVKKGKKGKGKAAEYIKEALEAKVKTSRWKVPTMTKLYY